MKQLFLVLALSVGTAGAAHAQQQAGSISGTVRDEQGGVLQSVAVSAKGADGTFPGMTDTSGEYRLPNLPPGRYEISATAQGFQNSVHRTIVEVGRTQEVAITMKLAIVSETVNVVSDAPLLDPKATGTTTNFGPDQLSRIPTARDPVALLRTVPGVLLDQFNVGGNETGQQAVVFGKAARQQDTMWYYDGVEITDVGAPGQSPTYYNWDNFEEIQVSTAGNDIRSRTGGVGINLISKRGTNVFRGGFRSYFSNDTMESSNVPLELQQRAVPVTPDTADHTDQISDYGFDVGGPIFKDRAWFYASLSQQDIKVYRRSTSAVDRTKLRNPQVKVNWQATGRDLVNFTFFNGYKLKDGRSTNTANISFEAPEATLHQDNAYADSPFHGLWKIGNDRILSSNTFLTAQYSYYNTGFALTPMGGMDAQAGRSILEARSYGSFSENLQIRPQHQVTADATQFRQFLGATHDLTAGFGLRRVMNRIKVEWPGNGILAIQQSATDLRAQVFRQGDGGNIVRYLDFYVGDTIRFSNLTVNAAVRYDRQWGEAMASEASASKAFPTVIPGIDFAGYDSPFTWNNVSPRVAMSYKLDTAGRTLARASYTRAAGQLAASTIGTQNPTTGSVPGNLTFRFNDLNGDRYAQADEVDLTQQIGAAGGGFNPLNPTAVTSANQLDPNLEAPITSSVVGGIDRELMPNVAVMVEYSYSRTSNLFGNLTANITPRVGIPFTAYVPGPTVTGTLPDGTAFSVPTFMFPPPPPASGFITRNVPGYYTDYHGIEVAATRRLDDRWMGRVAVSYNNAREHFTDPAGRYNTNGNPTPTAAEPLQDGGPFGPTTSVSSGVFLNSKWQFSANGLYIGPYDLEFAASVFGRQGYPLPIYRTTSLGVDTSTNVLVSPAIDTFRLENAWSTDIRIARAFRLPATGQAVNLRFAVDVFNLFNANTILARNSNLASPAAFMTVSKNLSPRIARLGVVVGF
jgi:hypothetical protein